jgi:hypothetical protein
VTEHGDSVEVVISGQIPQRDGFFRRQPAELEGPTENWSLARTTIDFGVAMFVQWNATRREPHLTDAVLQALLRRCLITSEGMVVLLSHGLLEPAVALSRTLLDNELAFRLILGDASGRMAKRLAAYHYLTYQRHGQDMLSDPPTRDGTIAKAGRIEELATIAGSYKRHFHASIFDEVRDDLKNARFWHGYENVEKAFAAVGQSSDYFMQYDAATWFVHDINVDFDYADRQDDQLVLKPLVERDPHVIQTHLGHQALRLATILRLLVDDRGYPIDPPFDQMSSVTFPDGRVEYVNALEALMGQLVSQFNVPRSPPETPGTLDLSAS